MRFTFLALILSVSLLSGCNTTRGVGEDVAATGNAISNAASQ